MGIPVRALEKGYYGQFRDPADPESTDFEVPDESHLASWMERLDGKGLKRTGKKADVTGTTGNNPVGASPPNPELDTLV